jgi:hypothetical protein
MKRAQAMPALAAPAALPPVALPTRRRQGLIPASGRFRFEVPVRTRGKRFRNFKSAALVPHGLTVRLAAPSRPTPRFVTTAKRLFGERGMDGVKSYFPLFGNTNIFAKRTGQRFWKTAGVLPVGPWRQHLAQPILSALSRRSKPPLATRILSDDRNQDETEGYQPREVCHRLRLIRDWHHRDDEARHRVDGERHGEEQEKIVRSSAPEFEKEQSGDE